MKKQLMITAMASSMVLAGCATNTGMNGTGTTNNSMGANKALIGAVLGAAAGAGISKATGSDHTGRNAAIGAAIGGGIGYYMQQQEKQLQTQMQGTGVKVERDPVTNDINLVMPSNITFDTARWDVKPSFNQTLNKVASTMQQFDKTKVLVMGHTDSVGDTSYNQGLSEKRAYSVASFLNNSGVAASRISTVGYGETRPIATNETDLGKSQNRRVEIKIEAPQTAS